MERKFFNIKDLKKSLEDTPENAINSVVVFSLEMLNNMINAKKPVSKKGKAFFSYKNINWN